MRHLRQKDICYMHSTFSQSVMVSMGVSKLELIDLIFVDAGVKMNGAYISMLLTQKPLPVMRENCAVFFTFQQCDAPAAHRV